MTDASNGGAPTPPQYNAPTPPAYAAPAAPATQPGRTLGIVALILAFLAAPIGAILGIVALVQSKKAGQKNGMALAAIIIGAIITVIWIIVMISSIALLATVANDPASIICSVEGASGQTFEDPNSGELITCP